MKKVFFGVFFFSFVLAAGFFLGKNGYKNGEKLGIAKAYPFSKNKEFCVIVCSYNNSRFVEKNLRSIFEQDYPHFRVIYIDDCSTDGTSEKVASFPQQKNHMTYIRNTKRMGAAYNFYMSIRDCRDEEIIVIVDGDDWLAHEGVLSQLNQVYQNPDIWLTYGQYLDYPTFQQGLCEPFDSKRLKKGGFRKHPWVSSHLRTFYAALFKKIKLGDFFYHGKPMEMGADCAMMIPMLEMAKDKYAFLSDILYIYNRQNILADGNVSFLLQKSVLKHIRSLPPYTPLPVLFSLEKPPSVDLVIFSYDRPMQLYACLESIQKYVKGPYQVTVLYRASNDRFAAGYEKVKEDFVGVQYLLQKTEDDFKPLLLQTLFDNPSSDYALFAVDDIIVKEGIDLNNCIAAMQKTQAYGFYLKLGKHTNYSYMLKMEQGVPEMTSLPGGLLAWDFEYGKGDFAYPNTLDMTLYFKKDLQKPFYSHKYHNPNSLEGAWSQESPTTQLALCYPISKVVNIPLNAVHISKNPHMQGYTTLQLLEKFEDGEKIDISPISYLKNDSVHIEYPVEFIRR